MTPTAPPISRELAEYYFFTGLPPSMRAPEKAPRKRAARLAAADAAREVKPRAALPVTSPS